VNSGASGTGVPLTSDSAPSANPRDPYGLRLLYVSVRGHKCLLGGPTLDADAAVPAAIGTRFGSLAEIFRYVPQELRGVSAFYQVQVVDHHGVVVCRGFRSGYNGTGERWTWRPDPASPPTPHPADRITNPTAT
jgi:hypothetical protein